jgi:chromosomal replication initiation ATPase DnaA
MIEKNIIEAIETLIDIGNLKSKSRNTPLNNQRSYLMYYLKENTSLSLNDIAKMFDKKQHGTVSNAIKKARKKMLDNCPSFESDIAFIKYSLKQ